MKAKKTARRIQVLSRISDCITDHSIYDTIKYRQRNENYIKQYLYQPLLATVEKMLVELSNMSQAKAKSVARKSLRWEGDQQTTVNNFVFFGTQHRPDYDLEFDDIRIAIEVKRGDLGTAIREGIGQSIVYTTNYEFCVYLFIDTSQDKKILNAYSSDREQSFVKSLFDDYNILFLVI